MVSRTLIIGTGDFARELMDLVMDDGPTGDCCFVANNQEELDKYSQRPYRARKAILETSIDVNDYFYIGVGDPQFRRKIAQKLAPIGPKFALINRSVVPDITGGDYQLVSREIAIEPGAILTPGVILTNRIKIGRHALINLGCTIGHDVTIGAYSNLSPGCHINGHTTIGEACSLGSGVVTIPGASICDNCVIGAGAVVRGKIDEPGVYVGIPAKKIK